MFFLYGAIFFKIKASEMNNISYEYNIEFSRKDIILYVFMVLLILISCSILCFFYATFEALIMSITNILILIIYFGFEWVNQEITNYINSEKEIQEDFKNILYISHALYEINYNLKSIGWNTNLDHLYNSFISKQQLKTVAKTLYELIELIDGCQEIQKPEFKISLKKIKDSLLIIINSINRNSNFDTYVNTQLCTNSHSIDKNYFCETFFNTGSMYNFIKRYDGYSIYDYRLFKPKNTLDYDNYYIETSGDEFYKIHLAFDDYKIQIYKKNNMVLNILILTLEDEIIDNICFINNYPMYLINNEYIYMSNFGSLKMDYFNNKFYVKNIEISDAIVTDTIYRFNKYVIPGLKIMFKKNNVYIYSENKNINISEDNIINLF